MGVEPQTIQIEDLLEHADWARSLARSLVEDASTADDIVQETWLAALRHPPRHDRNLRGWIGRLIQNFAHRRRRDDRIRNDHQALRDPRDPEATPEELAVAVELQRELGRLVLSLEEPYRSTILLRYYRGLGSSEVARRQGVPAGTVRWRLCRALDELRTRLDAEAGGDRAVWVGALIRVAAPDSKLLPVGGAVLGGMLMSIQAKLALLAVFLGGLFLVGRALLLEEAVEIDRRSKEGESRELVEWTEPVPAETLAPGSAIASPGRAPILPPAGIPVRILVLDQHEKRPIPGVRVRTYDDPAPAEGVTDAAGRCVLSLTSRPVLKLEFTARGFDGIRQDSRWKQDWTVELEPVGTLVGRVVDEDTGEPIAGARIEGPRATGALAPAPTTSTDADGGYRLDRVPLRMDTGLRVWAEGYGSQGSSWNLLDLENPIELNFRLPKNVFIDILVVDHSTGEPVPGAEVGWGPKAITDDRGRVTKEATPRRDTGEIELRVKHRDYLGLGCTLQSGDVDRSPLEFRLVRGGRFEGILQDEEGVPLPGVKIEFYTHGSCFQEECPHPVPDGPILPVLPDGWGYSGEPDGGARTDENGYFLSSRLLPFERGYEVSVRGDFAGAGDEFGLLEGPDARTWLDLTVRKTEPGPSGPTGSIAGRITLNGRPLESSVFWKSGEESGRKIIQSAYDYLAGKRGANTGSYFFPSVPAGEVELAVRLSVSRYRNLDRYLEGTHVVLSVEEGQEVEHDFDLQLPLASIRGRVTLGDGAPPPGLTLTIFDTEERVTRRARVGGDGSWESDVPDLGWEFIASMLYAGKAYQIRGVRAGDEDLELILPLVTRIPIRVREAETGRIVRKWEVAYRVRGEEEWRFGEVLKDSRGAPHPDGSYHVEVLPGELELLIRDPNLGRRTTRVEGFLVRGDETREVLDVEAERGLELEVVLAEGVEVPPPHEIMILLLEPEAYDTVRLGPDRRPGRRGAGFGGSNGYLFETGPFYRTDLLKRRVYFGSDRSRVLRGLSPGRWRFKAFPKGTVVEPAEVTLPHEGPLEIRWRR